MAILEVPTGPLPKQTYAHRTFAHRNFYRVGPYFISIVGKRPTLQNLLWAKVPVGKGPVGIGLCGQRSCGKTSVHHFNVTLALERGFKKENITLTFVNITLYRHTAF